MRIVGGGVEAVTEVGYRRARVGGGSEAARLPVGRLRVDRLPAGCDAVLVAGDLQGVAPSPWGGPPVLLGVALADFLTVWAQEGSAPAPERVGVVLAGDLYAAPAADRRGASGAVRDVWWAFAAAGCPFVVGVAGNHDEVSTADLVEAGPHVVLLDGAHVDVGGVRFAGVGRIIGDPNRPGRRAEETQTALVDRVLGATPDVLILHEGPPGATPTQPGRAEPAARIRAAPPSLTICGHVHWPVPVAPTPGGHTLNTDARAILLTV
ncbi:metallophosphoesterase family protein [Embleya sp. NPDC055664]